MPSEPLPPLTPEAVLYYWFGDGLALGWPSDDRNPLWFGGGAAVDADITRRFGPDRIETGGEFESIAAGLALIGLEPDVERWTQGG